jgi:FKBP-type peptidyl-prolyl cis-trans isomerase SlyD
VIQDGSKVKVHYMMKVQGQVVQSTFGEAPLTYVQGSGQILSGLEKELEGLNEGDKKGFELPPERAYGQIDPKAFRKVSRSAFRDPENIRRGQKVTGELDGKKFEAAVAEVASDNVTLDMNHPLAGRTLEFKLEVVEVR